MIYFEHNGERIDITLEGTNHIDWWRYNNLTR